MFLIWGRMGDRLRAAAYEAGLHGEDGDLGARAEVQFGEYIRDVSLDGALAYHQLLGNRPFGSCCRRCCILCCCLAFHWLLAY